MSEKLNSSIPSINNFNGFIPSELNGCNLSVDRFFHGKLFPLLLMLLLLSIQ